jgi:phosphoglycerate dehydrogenase-like enzyme
MTSVLVAVLGGESQALVPAVHDGGAKLGAVENASGLIWTGGAVDELAEALCRAALVRWVQLPSAGVEAYAALLDEHRSITWTSAKGLYGGAVGEHAVAMLLTLRRSLLDHAVSASWSTHVATRPLWGSGDTVVLLGGGGIAQTVAELLAPYQLRVLVVRRSDSAFPAPHAAVFGQEAVDDALRDADAVISTLPLTECTRGLLDERRLRLLAPGAVVVNVGRGGTLDQRAVLELLKDGTLAGAGLDVTEPEPLPSDDPLWRHPRCLITSHTSNPDDWRRARFAELVEDNVGRHVRDEPLRGQVDPTAGY